MKTLKFRKALSELILKGEKTTTWRLFDDKDLKEGEVISFIIWETGEEFAKAKLLEVKETTLGHLSDDDWDGHESFSSNKEMYETYSLYYKMKVDENSPVKILKFKLVQ